MLTFSTDQIKEISEQLNCGFRAFYHKQSGELIFVPATYGNFDMDTSAWETELAELNKNFIAYQEINAMEGSDSFKLMADFAAQVSDEKLQDRLLNSLNKKHPFREFKSVIDNSGEYRKRWFDFKNERYILWTEDQINAQKEHDNLA